MIGLGSNRLSVCRRGGMSVTQAGKGGMEWLAGGRRPSWASPYSAQATAALKDAFTAAQWMTIRDYGFAHPEIVGYMNANPLGFGELIAYYQMCEYINTNGANAVQISIAQSGNIMEYEVMKTGGGAGESACVGGRVSAGASATGEIYFQDGKIAEYGSGLHLIDPVIGSNAPDNTKMTLKFSVNLTGNLMIGQYRLGDYVWYGNIYGARLLTPQDADVIWLRPCYRKTDGEIGLFDVINREFKTNIGSGTFLKGSDIYYPGQSPA